MEIWKQIEGYDNYMVSNLGRVKSLKFGKEKVLKYGKDSGGYLTICLCKDGKVKRFLIHRLIAKTFLPNPDNKPCIDHINTNRSDNRVNNLRWATYKDNSNNPITKEKMSVNNGNLGKFGKLNPNHKPILQFDLNGNFIRRWESAMDIERELNISHSQIAACCRGKIKTSYGYKWGYVEEYELIPFKVFDLKIYRKKVA